MKKQNIFRLMAVLFAVFIAAMSMPMDSFADSVVGNIQVEIPADGAKYYCIKIADYNEEKGTFSTTAAYMGSGVADITDNKNAGWLEVYTRGRHLENSGASTNVSSGSANFGISEKGIYLVFGDGFVSADGYYYTFLPAVVAIPTKNEDGTDEYNINVVSKWNSDIIPGNPVNISVIKQWDDKGYENSRPTSIDVKLVGSNGVVKMATLYGPGWSYTWNYLDADVDWTVQEVVPNGYKVQVNGPTPTNPNAFTLINTYSPPPSPPPSIPQTGMLWWPVAVLAFGGIAFFALGVSIKRKSDEDA